MFSITGARHASKANQAIPVRYAPASKISGDGAADQASNSRNKGVIDRMWRPLTPVKTLKCTSIQREFKGYHIWKRTLMQRLDLLSFMNLTPTPQSRLLVGPAVEFRAALRDNAIAMGGSGRETEAGKIWEGWRISSANRARSRVRVLPPKESGNPGLRPATH